MRAHVGVVGHRGYSGGELVRLLSHHSFAAPVLLDHRDSGPEGPQFVNPSKILRASATAKGALDAGVQAVFLATPPEVSMQLAPEFLAAGIKVIDLSGAFRLRTAEAYLEWYKEPHTQPDLLAEAAYGLPEFYRDSIRPARLVANPGCYPTAANLALRPLLRANAIDLAAGIVCDAKSGVSGAGRKPSLKTSFCEVTENFSAYSFSNHRHVPEVLLNSGLEAESFSFTAQLIPIHRGILETIHFRAAEDTTASGILDIYQAAYDDEPFVRLRRPGSIPEIRDVAHTNFCDIGLHYNATTRRGVVVSAIDNLIKGAAGQAVQNLNLISGWPETEGLL